MRSDEEEGAVCESSESSWEVEKRLSPVKRKIRGKYTVRANAKAKADVLITGEAEANTRTFTLSNRPRFPLNH